MKRKFRVLLAVLAGLFLVLDGSGCTSKAKKAYHLNRAEHYYQAGDLDSAEVEYVNVLRRDPENAEAFSRLGIIYYEEGRLQRALFFLSKASQLAPDNLEVRVKLGFVQSSAGQLTNALAQANFILDRKPQDEEAPLLLAEAALSPKAAAAARTRLQTLARNGDRAPIEVALGNLDLHARDLAAASLHFKKAQTLDAKSPSLNVGLGTLAWEQGDLKQADAFFKAAADASPARSPRRLQYVRFKLETGDFAGADALLAQMGQVAANYLPAFMLRAQVAGLQKKFDEAQNFLDKVQKLDADNFDGLFFQGEIDLARGDAARAVADLDRMARLYPGVAAVHFQLGKAYLAANDLTQAATSLERVLALDPNFTDATILLAQIQVQAGNPDPAITSLEALRKKQPGNVRVQLLLADAFRLRNQLSEALAIYNSLEQAYPTNAEVALLHGAALLQSKDNVGARQAFERVLHFVPGDLPAIRELVDLDIGEKQFDAARQLIDREAQRNPKETVLGILNAKILLAEGKKSQAEASLQQVLQLDANNEAANLLLAQMYSDAGQGQQALAKANAVVARNPHDPAALMLAAKIDDANKNHQGAADAYEQLLKIDPKFSPALNNLAYLYSEYLNNSNRAYELAQRARELAPFDPRTADTLGWICYQRGSYDTALGLLKDSAAKLSDPEVQFHLGMTGYMTGDEATARQALQRAWQSGANFPGRAECSLCLSNLEVNPATADADAQARLEKRVAEKADDPVAWLRLALICERLGNTEKAIAAFEALHQAAPKNVAAMLNLARLYASKDPRKAYDIAKEANKVAPYDPIVAHELGRLAFGSGDYNVAVSMLQQALQNEANNPGWLYDYALAAYSIGKVPQAQSALQNALSRNLAAEPAALARRMLDLIALAANPAQAAGAGPRIAEVLKTDPDDVPALMARGVASEANSDNASAEKTFEQVLSHYPDFLPAQKELARLYSAETGKADHAYAMAVKVHDALPDDPDADKVLGAILVQRGDYSRAAALLTQSAAQMTPDAEAFYYLGAAQFHLKQRTDSKANLQKALASHPSPSIATAAKQLLSELK